jgi:hypothetical protein
MPNMTELGGIAMQLTELAGQVRGGPPEGVEYDGTAVDTRLRDLIPQLVASY